MSELTKIVPRKTWTMRLRDRERFLLEAAAAARGERLGEFVRTAAIEAARRELAEQPAGR